MTIPLNIGYVVPYFNPNIGSFEYNLCKGLAKLGHNVTLYTSERIKSSSNRTKKDFLQKGISLMEGFTVKRFRTFLEPRVRISGFPFVPGIPLALLNEDLDVIHAASHEQPCSLEALVVAKKRNIPFTYTHWAYHYPPGWMKYALFSLERTFFRPLWSSTKKIIATSGVAKNFLMMAFGVPENRIALVNGGAIDTDLFNPANVSKTKARERMSIQDEWTVLSVANLHEGKGLDHLIRAFALVQKKRRKAKLKLIIIGKGPEKENLIKLALDLGLRKNFSLFDISIPYRQMPWIYAAADVFALPTLSEQVGRVLIEAMSMQVPVIATHIGGIPDNVKHGETGLLVAPRDERQLAEAILKLYDEKEFFIKIGLNGRRFVENNSDYLQMAKQTVQVYEDLLKSN